MSTELQEKTAQPAPVAESLPDVAAHPVVFFDGVCGLCNASVDYILARDPGGVFRFAPLQGETATRCLTPDDIASLKSLVLLDQEGIHRRSAGIWRILRRLGGFQRILGSLLWSVPSPLRDLGYRFVSANRYRIFGKHDTCRMPSPEERARFLP
jgi:predicted DCC family thiol-disulfide oxidoreductase YuxK